MALFFEKYKKMRKDQKIDLTDIENRTKINVKYLEALESGNFDQIQKPYLRLFLKAYITEIGADPDVALSELTEFQLQMEGTPEPESSKTEVKTERKEPPKPTKKPEAKMEKKESKNFGEQIEAPAPIVKRDKNQLSISPNLIKGILFIAAWILIIIAIRYVTLESEAEGQFAQQNNSIELISNYVDFEQLRSDFLETSDQQTALEINPPYIVKIITRNILGVVSQKDTFNIESAAMAAGSQSTIYYDTLLDIVLKHTNGVSIMINGESIDDIISQPNPVRLIFNTNPNTLAIKHYSPIE